MSEVKHTPGPWEVVEWVKRNGRTESVTIEYRDLVIAECYRPVGLVQTALDNARLIAAAPEMLESLRTMEAQLAMASATLTPGCKAAAVRALKAARAAIAKAEGL